MEKVYLPYNGTQIATFIVNGHQLLFATHDPDVMTDYMREFGADSVQAVEGDQYQSEEELVKELQNAVGAQVVMAGDGAELDDVMTLLRAQLPWKQ